MARKNILFKNLLLKTIESIILNKVIINLLNANSDFGFYLDVPKVNMLH